MDLIPTKYRASSSTFCRSGFLFSPRSPPALEFANQAFPGTEVFSDSQPSLHRVQLDWQHSPDRKWKHQEILDKGWVSQGQVEWLIF